MLLNETRNWIKKLENPIQFANYTNDIDSVDNLIAERLLLSSIIKSYQLKRTILSQKLSKAQDKNEIPHWKIPSYHNPSLHIYHYRNRNNLL